MDQQVQECFHIMSFKTVKGHNHTERQAARQAARSHWNALWRFKMGPRSIPKRQPKRPNFKAAAWRSVCLYSYPQKLDQSKSTFLRNNSENEKLIQNFKKLLFNSYYDYFISFTTNFI